VNFQDGYAILLQFRILDLARLPNPWPSFCGTCFFCGRSRRSISETPEFNLHQFQSAIDVGLFQEEGRLKGHRFYDGNYWDYLILAVYRTEAEEFLERNPWLFEDRAGVGPQAADSSMESLRWRRTCPSLRYLRRAIKNQRFTSLTSGWTRP